MSENGCEWIDEEPGEQLRTRRKQRRLKRERGGGHHSRQDFCHLYAVGAEEMVKSWRGLGKVNCGDMF